MALLFVPGAVEAFSGGTFFRKVIALILRFLGVLSGIGGVVLVVLVLRGMGTAVGIAEGAAKVGVVIGGLLSAVAVIIASYVFVHLFFLRARTVSSLERDEFVALPILVVLTRLVGELGAAWIALTAILGFLVAWMMGGAAGSFSEALPGNPLHGIAGGGFLSGILILIGGAITAVLGLLGAYYLAESIVLLLRIARNTTLIADATRRT